MAPTLIPPSHPPNLDEQWSAYIVIVAVLFLIAVFTFYVYTAR